VPGIAVQEPDVKNDYFDKYCRVGKSMVLTAGVVAGTTLLAIGLLAVIGTWYLTPIHLN